MTAARSSSPHRTIGVTAAKTATERDQKMESCPRADGVGHASTIAETGRRIIVLAVE